MQEAMRPVIWRFEQLAERIAGVARVARGAGVPVIAVQQTGPAGSSFDPEAAGWPLSDMIGITDGDLCVSKTATDSFYETELAERLADHAIRTVVIAGVATDYCVDATARSALSHGLNVDLIRDGHAPAADGDRRAGLTPEQIIEHHNLALSQAIHPGGQLRLIAAAEVFSR